MTLLDENELTTFLSEHDGWERSGEAIVRTYEFDDFVGAMGFVTSVALLSEKASHHPDIDVRWNKVTLSLSTHSEDGLTNKDTELAAQIDDLVA